MTVIAFAPGTSAIAGTDHFVVPTAMPEAPAAFDHSTRVTSTSSDALPPSASTLPDVTHVGASVGIKIVAVGGAASFDGTIR